jgi:hypothetical protein
MMEKSKTASRKGWQNGWRLFLSPFIGAWSELTAPRPPAVNWKDAIVIDLRLYFAPLTGAVRGFKKVFGEIWRRT